MAKTTIAALRAEIAEHEQTITEADRELAIATLEGHDVSAIHARRREAREAIEHLTLAIEEVERRQTEAQDRERELQAAASRQEAYEWVAEHAAALERIAKALAEAKEAEAEVERLAGDPRRAKVRLGLMNKPCDLDVDVITLTPRYGITSRPTLRRELPGFSSPSSMAQLRELATQRAKEEAAGQGRDHTGEREQRQREYIEAHERQVRERQEREQARQRAIERQRREREEAEKAERARKVAVT